MKKIGILFGREDTFQWALIDEINRRKVPGIAAEPVRTGHVTMAVPTGYALIYDRISHDIPFYRVLLKNEVLCGTQVINDPFWALADDKFFENALAEKLGVAVPKTVLLPHRDHPPDTDPRSMRNLIYPLDWDGIFKTVGFPCYMKQFYGGGWKHVHKIHNPEELFGVYNQTGTHLMMLQEGIEFESYYRCYCIGREHVRVMPYEPRNEHAKRYQAGHAPLSKDLHARIVRDTLTLNRALGYDVNTAEFAVRKGIPIAIDFMNWAPDCDRASVGEENFKWVVGTVADLLIARAQKPQPMAFKTWQEQVRG